jgi:hypothetical protein
MRLVRGILALTLLLLAGCGSTEPSVSPAELFMEYARSTEVRNDRFPTSDGASEDRLANFAAHGTPQQIQNLLFQAFDCESAGGNFPVSRCEAGVPVKKAAETFGGTLYGRSIVVRHADGSLELVTLYVAADGDRAQLIDPAGETYTDLEAFRAGNDLLDSQDMVLTLRDITSVPGEGEIVVVTGHTPSTWQWWLLGGFGVLVLLVAAGLVIRRARRRAVLPGEPGHP